METGILIQARTSSQRLPGKVLYKLGKTNMNSISLIIKRLNNPYLNKISRICFLTSDKECDNAIEYYCYKNNVDVFRGNEDDVLDRYYKASKYLKLKTIIRLTADCPFIDNKEVKRILSEHNKFNNDYTTNSFEGSSIVDGCDVEVFTFEALEKAHMEAKESLDREHVTTYFHKKNEFKISLSDPNFPFAYTRLTLDTSADFKVISELIDLVDDPIRTDIEDYARIYHNKNLSKINNYIARNSGWGKGTK